MQTNAQRRGLFWDVLAGRVSPPPAAVTLGWELVQVDPEQGTIEVSFEAGDQFTNPVVQFLRPARPGKLLGRGRVVQRGKDVCFLAGELIGSDGRTVAVATATARIASVQS